jgi:hypothetical protein
MFYALFGDTIRAAFVLFITILAVAAWGERRCGRPFWIFVIYAPHQRCYSDHPVRGIQWPGGPTCNN